MKEITEEMRTKFWELWNIFIDPDTNNVYERIGGKKTEMLELIVLNENVTGNKVKKICCASQVTKILKNMLPYFK